MNNLRNAKQIAVFLKNDPTEIKENFPFFIHNPLLLGHLNERKFRHGFGEKISPTCVCNVEIESTEHFLLCCSFPSYQRLKLFDKVNKINPSLFKLSAKDQVKILLYGYSSNNSVCLHY